MVTKHTLPIGITRTTLEIQVNIYPNITQVHANRDFSDHTQLRPSGICKAAKPENLTCRMASLQVKAQILSTEAQSPRQL